MKVMYADQSQLRLFSLHEKSLKQAQSNFLDVESRITRLALAAKNMERLGVDNSEINAAIELMQSWAEFSYKELIKAQENMVQDHINSSIIF